MTFKSLGLRAELVRAVTEKGYSEPTPIQAQAIPAILKGNDLLGSAQTGTGKTAGFTLPLLQRLFTNNEKSSGRRPIRGLVITPTRELAAQVAASIEDYGKWLPLKSAVVFGGVNINPQKRKLEAGVDILVATPGRLLDHANQRTVDLSKVEFLVLDEADRMLDMGFIHDIRKLLNLLPAKKQTLLFSATYSPEIRKLAGGLLNSPTKIEVAPQKLTLDTIKQTVHPVDKSRKRELLSYLIGSKNWQQVLVFGRTKHGANRLAKQLNEDGIKATAIHGNKSQNARTQALADFKLGKVQVLVATDIAARGLDISHLPHVINFELPNVAEDYVHRIGRTGRAGREGEAISLVSVDERDQLKDIERLIKRKIPRELIEDYHSGVNFETDLAPPTPKSTQRPKSQRNRNQNQNQNQNKNQNNYGNRSTARTRSY